MRHLNIAKLAATPVDTAPFDHVVVPARLRKARRFRASGREGARPPLRGFATAAVESSRKKAVKRCVEGLGMRPVPLLRPGDRT